MNLRDKILAARDRKLREYFVPEWDTTVYLQTLSAKDRYTIGSLASKGNQAEVTAKLVIAAVCDEQGNSIFTDKDKEVLLSKSGAVVEKLALEIIDSNAMSSEGIQELRKNSNPTQQENSCSN